MSFRRIYCFTTSFRLISDGISKVINFNELSYFGLGGSRLQHRWGNLWAQALCEMANLFALFNSFVKWETVGECDFYCQLEALNARRAQFNNNLNKDRKQRTGEQRCLRCLLLFSMWAGT